jgi:hypothetical protein
MATIVNQRWILIRNIIIYLETKFRPNRTILYFGGHFRYKMATVANQRWISIRNIIVYLETKFRPNRRIFVFWRPFWIQNGHHSKQKWSPYGAACLTTSKYPFPLKSFHFWIFNDFLNFYIGGHFEMVAIFKWRPFWNGSHFENSKTWMHLLRWGSTFLWSLVKIGSSVSENLVGQNRSERKWRKNNNN